MDIFKTIQLDNGTKLELECTESLLDAVRQYFSLSEKEKVSDDQLQEFITVMCRNAVKKAELEEMKKVEGFNNNHLTFHELRKV